MLYMECLIQTLLSYISINQMGQSNSKKIRVATLNYSGITLSPFQFQISKVQDADKNSDTLANRLSLIMQKLNLIFLMLMIYDKNQRNFISNDQKDENVKKVRKNIKQVTVQEIMEQINDKFILKLNNKNDQNQQQINKKYNQNKKYIQEQYKLKIGAIDKQMLKQRYTPIYRKGVGVKNGNSFLDEQGFNNKWDKQFEKNRQYIQFEKPAQVNEAKPKCRKFDYLCYKTFVQYSYLVVAQKQKNEIFNQDHIKQNIKFDNRNQKKQITKKAVEIYLQTVDDFFQLSYMDQQKKAEKVWQLYEKNDIVFLQDLSPSLINYLKVDQSVDIILSKDKKTSAILINNKKQKFKQLFNENEILQKQKYPKLTLLDFAQYAGQKIAVCFVDNFLLISAHFSKTKDKDKKKQIPKDKSQKKKSKQQQKQEKEIKKKEKEKQQQEKKINKQQIKKLKQKLKDMKNNQTNLTLDKKEKQNYKKIIFQSITNFHYFAEHLGQISKQHPNLIIIAGGDFNQWIDQSKEKELGKFKVQQNRQKKETEEIFELAFQSPKDILQKYGFGFYPTDQKQYTTKKKRTFLQAQTEKALEEDLKCRDFIISNYKMINKSKTKIKEQQYLPNDDHPFDHSYIWGTVDLETPIKNKNSNHY